MIDKKIFSIYNYLHEVRKKKMEQLESIPFSALVAGVLLRKTECTSVEIAKILSNLEMEKGVMIDDENDNLDALSCCVEMGSNYDFYLKKGLKYSTVLNQDITVFKFLMIHTNQMVLSFLDDYFKEVDLSKKVVESVCSVEKINESKSNLFSFKRKTLTRKKMIATFFI